MLARVRRWGNGLAVRLPKALADKMGISEGDVIQFEVSKRVRRGGLNLANIPTFHDEDPRVSVDHDRFLYGEIDEDS